MSIAQLEAHLRAQPHDWASWLVYGDWLSDQGDVRGRLITLEHRVATGRLPPGELRALAAEIEQTTARYKPRWRANLPEQTEVRWHHGFLLGVTLPWKSASLALLEGLLAHPDARFLVSLSLRPPLSGVEVYGAEDDELDEDEEDYDEQEKDAEDAEDAEEAVEDEDAEEYGEEWQPRRPMGLSPPLAHFLSLDLSRLTALDLAYSAIGDEGAQAVAAAPALGGLTSLDLRYNGLGDQGLAALARSPHLGRLTALYLQRNEIGAEGAIALASSPHLRGLERLDLRYNPIGAAGAAALASAPNLAGLTSLSLYREDIGADGARALSRSEHLPLHIRRYWKGQ